LYVNRVIPADAGIFSLNVITIGYAMSFKIPELRFALSGMTHSLNLMALIWSLESETWNLS